MIALDMFQTGLKVEKFEENKIEQQFIDSNFRVRSP